MEGCAAGMKKTLRSMMENSCPDVLNAIVSVRRRRMFRQRFSSLHEEVRQRLYPNGAEVAVRSGPFQGMRYLDEIVWGSVTPRWLGCYEWELHGAVRQILDRGYKTIIDVGCAEGYYAVGLALGSVLDLGPRAGIFSALVAAAVLQVVINVGISCSYR